MPSSSRPQPHHLSDIASALDAMPVSMRSPPAGRPPSASVQCFGLGRFGVWYDDVVKGGGNSGSNAYNTQFRVWEYGRPDMTYCIFSVAQSSRSRYNWRLLAGLFEYASAT
jgi:hypothetical protein